jgi:effector-binding domain-containing protein
MKGIEIVTTKAQNAIAIREKVKIPEIPQTIGRMFEELMPMIQGGVKCVGPPFALYHSWSNGVTDMEVGFPITGKGMSKGRVKPMELPAVKAAVLMHIGPYDKLSESWEKMQEWMKANGHQPAEICWEEYLSDPDDTPPEKLMTKLFWPIK